MPRPAMRTCTSTRTGFHPVSHASPVTKGARKSQEEGPRRASSVGFSRDRKIVLSEFAFDSALSACAYPMSCGSTWTVSLVGAEALGLLGLTSRGWVSGNSTRSSLRRIEPDSSLHPKEEEAGSVKSASCVATTAGPTPAAGEDSARRIRARVSYFENSLQKSKGCDWLREASASIRQAGVHGGLAEPIAFANATRYRSGERAQWDGTLAAKPTKAGQARDMKLGRLARSRFARAANVARRRPKKCTFRWKSCPFAMRRGLHGLRRRAN